MKNENTRLLRWEAENLTVLSYFVAYIGGLLTVRKSCFEAPHLSASPLRFFTYARGFEAGGFLSELLLPIMANRSYLRWWCFYFWPCSLFSFSSEWSSVTLLEFCFRKYPGHSFSLNNRLGLKIPQTSSTGETDFHVGNLGCSKTLRSGQNYFFFFRLGGKQTQTVMLFTENSRQKAPKCQP